MQHTPAVNTPQFRNRESDFYYSIRFITAPETTIVKEPRTSVGRRVSAAEMRYRRVYGNATTDQMIAAGTVTF